MRLHIPFIPYRLPVPVDLLDRHVSHDGPLVTLQRLLRHEDNLVRVLRQDSFHVFGYILYYKKQGESDKMTLLTSQQNS